MLKAWSSINDLLGYLRHALSLKKGFSIMHSRLSRETETYKFINEKFLQVKT